MTTRDQNALTKYPFGHPWPVVGAQNLWGSHCREASANGFANKSRSNNIHVLGSLTRGKQHDNKGSKCFKCYKRPESLLMLFLTYTHPIFHFLSNARLLLEKILVDLS